MSATVFGFGDQLVKVTFMAVEQALNVTLLGGRAARVPEPSPQVRKAPATPTRRCASSGLAGACPHGDRSPPHRPGRRTP